MLIPTIKTTTESKGYILCIDQMLAIKNLLNTTIRRKNEEKKKRAYQGAKSSTMMAKRRDDGRILLSSPFKKSRIQKEIPKDEERSQWVYLC